MTHTNNGKLKTMLTMPTRVRLSRPEHRLELFKDKLSRPLSDAERNRVLARMVAAERAMNAAVQLTSRDFDILEAVARFRFMTSHQIIRFLTGLSARELKQLLQEKPWAHQQILRRLQTLHDRHLLIRPPQQDLQLSAFGALVYGITSAGARELLANGHVVNAELDWQLKNSRASGQFLAHTLGTTETMLHFAIAARSRDLELIDHHDLVPYLSASAQRVEDPFKLRVTIEHERKPLDITVVPDRLFALRYPDTMVNTFALEFDRNSLDITSKRLAGKASFVRKIAGVYGCFRQNKFLQQWNTKSLRMLTVTSGSEKRIKSMCEAQLSVTRGNANDLFLYCTAETLAEHGPFAQTWTRADGTTTSILRA
jgi:hypothetical protein